MIALYIFALVLLVIGSAIVLWKVWTCDEDEDSAEQREWRRW